MSQTEIQSYYNTLAHSYDQSRFGNSYGAFIHAAEYAILAKELDRNASPTLDIACGTGRFTALAHIGIDISENMIEVAKNKYPDKKFFVCNAKSLPFSDSYIKQIIAFHLFMHLTYTDFQEILQECARVCASNGIFILDMPSAKRRKLLGYKKSGWHGNTAYTLEQIKELIPTTWRVDTLYGFLFLPIHRFPTFLRKYLLALDRLLSQSFLKEYASYYIVILKRV